MAEAPTDAAGKTETDFDPVEWYLVQLPTVGQGVTAGPREIATRPAVSETLMHSSTVASQASIDTWRCSLHYCAA